MRGWPSWLAVLCLVPGCSGGEGGGGPVDPAAPAAAVQTYDFDEDAIAGDPLRPDVTIIVRGAQERTAQQIMEALEYASDLSGARALAAGIDPERAETAPELAYA